MSYSALEWAQMLGNALVRAQKPTKTPKDGANNPPLYVLHDVQE